MIRLLLSFVFACCSAYAEEPGAIYLRDNSEIYLPDPIVMIHGVASDINTYEPAIPDINSRFYNGSTSKYNYNHVDITNTALAHYFTKGESTLVLPVPVVGFDYRN